MRFAPHANYGGLAGRCCAVERRRHDQVWSICKCGGEVYVESSVDDMYVFPMEHPPLITLKIHTDYIDNYTHSCPSVLNTVYVHYYFVGIQKQSQAVNLQMNELVFPVQF